MKHLLLSLCLFIACAQVSVAQRVSDRERDGFVGPVKRVSVESSPIHRSWEDVPVGARCRSSTNVYDEAGRLTQYSLYPGTCGEDEVRMDFTYAQDGSRTTKYQEIRGENSPPPPPPPAPPPGSASAEKGPARKVSKYDPSGRLAEEATIMPSGRVLYKTNYSYDAKGRLIETASGGAAGSVSRSVYTYTGEDRVPSGYAYVGSDGKMYEKTAYSDYEFNPRGDWVKRKVTTEGTFNRRSVSWTFREIEYYPSGK
ncbi:MAG TPA: hypothetical protein VD861_06875 [Pyrinomonadaceae bacterium]|nr:hypothetical protein [Pyrinomonadaceae bacterium]